MNKSIVPLICAAAVMALRNSSASLLGQRPVEPATYFAGYSQQDTDSDVQTDRDSEGDYNVFYDRLAPDGQWLNDDDYGYVWQPNVAVSTTSWRPYSDGHWVWTDRGWFWQSNENFGWATYHYGRWVLIDGAGWVWVPGRQWAPAWVSWRHTDNDDYVGWAPLPPESSFNVNVGIHPWCDNYYDIGPAAFAFIRIGDFGRPSYRDSYLPQQQNLGFFNRTTNITNITYNNNVINNFGPQYQRVSEAVQQQGGQQLPSYKINYAAQTQANAAFKASTQGNQLNVLAPPQTLRPTATVKPPVAKELGKTKADRGWQNVPDSQAKVLRQQYTQQAPVPQDLPAKPVLPAKPQVQAATKGEQRPPTEPGKSPQAPGGQLKPLVEKPGNKAPGEQQNLETQKPKPVQPQNPKPGEPPRQPAVTSEERKDGTATVPTEKPQTEVRKPSQPQNPKPVEPPKQPSVTSEERKAETATVPTEKPRTEVRKPSQPENPKPVEPPRQPVTSEERKAGTATVPTEKPQTEVRKGESEQVQPKPEAKRPAENQKPAGHEGAPQHKKDETKKEPPPQAKASQQNGQHQSRPQTHGAQPKIAEVHIAQSHAPQPHAASASQPKSNAPPQARKAPSNNNQKKKEVPKA